MDMQKTSLFFIGCVMTVVAGCGQEPASVGMMQCNDLRTTLEELRGLRPIVEAEIHQEKSPITRQTFETLPPSDAYLAYEAKAQQVIAVVTQPAANKGECSMGDYKTSVQVPQKPEIEGHLKRFRELHKHHVEIQDQHELIEALREINPEFAM